MPDHGIDLIADALMEFAVHAGYHERRRVLAAELLADGVTAADIDLLGRSVEGDHAEVSVVGRRLAAVLSDPEQRRARIADLKLASAARTKRQERPVFGEAQRQRPGPVQDEEPTWEQEQACRRAYCRVVSDRAAPAAVAAELGIPEGEIAALVERGRAMAADEVERSRIAKTAGKPKAAP